jgi:hypothetical protein
LHDVGNTLPDCDSNLFKVHAGVCRHNR